MAKTQNIPTETRTVNLVASSLLWNTFDEWMQRQGCQTFTEGLRTAIRQVTGFNGECQEKSPILTKNNSGEESNEQGRTE